MILAAFLAGAVPLLARPTAELGFSDDWSYARMAFDVAKTGHFHYDGWAAAAVGPQAYWGALFVRLFGESFVALRISVLVVAAGTGGVLYQLATMCGLSRSNALQASAAVMLSPVTIPLSASFMSDVPALFLATLSILFCAQALRAQRAGASTGCFILALASAFIGGLVRQIIWVVLLSVIPLVVWLANIPRRWRIVWIIVWAATLLCMVLSMMWLAHQPYLIRDKLFPSLLAPLKAPATAGIRLLRILLSGVMLLIPIAPALWPALRRIRLSTWAISIVIAMILIATTAAMRGAGKALDPWLGNIVLRSGCLEPGIDMIGQKPMLVPQSANAACALLAWVGLSVVLVLGLRNLRRFMGICPQKSVVARSVRASPALYLLMAFAVPVLVLCVGRAVVFMAFDRYLLPILPLAVLLLMRLRQGAGGMKSSRASWLLIAVFGAVGVAFLFEFHETARARLAALAILNQAHIPRTQICGGVEIDGPTQLAEWGYIHYPGISLPADAYVPLEENSQWGADRYWFWPCTPSIMPQYVLARSPVSGYKDAGLGQLSYRSLFPPFHRPLYILKLVDPARRPMRVPPGTKVPGDRIIRNADVSVTEAK